MVRKGDQVQGNLGPGLRIVPAGDIKVVSKPWGWERWIAEGGPAFPYMFKIIRIHAPHRTSLQFHEHKHESNHLLEGRAVLHYAEKKVDASRFKSGGYTAAELAELLSSIRVRPLASGDTVHVPPCFLHRIEAVDSDITLIEASTDHADDVFRIEDDTFRSHGRVAHEHAEEFSEG